MKIGVILTGYNMEEYVAPCLRPWVNWRMASKHEMLICSVNSLFEGFPVEPPDRTRMMMEARMALGEIDHLIVSDTPVKETEARGNALRWLVDRGVTIVLQLDLDETWSQEQITSALAFVEANPWVQWFRVPYKQLVFTRDQWLAEPFTPPRIHRTHTHGGYVAAGFWDDNNVFYRRPWHGEVVRDIELASMTIPQALVWVPHATWLNDSRSRAKERYQSARWAPPVGAGCSFRWDEERGLVWNEAYFALTGQPIPQVLT